MRAPGGQSAIFAKVRYILIPACGQTFFCHRSRTFAFPALWTVSASAPLQILMSLAVWNRGFLMHSERSIGCIWHRDTRFVFASVTLRLDCFEWASRRSSSFAGNKYGYLRTNPPGVAQTVGLVLGVS